MAQRFRVNRDRSEVESMLLQLLLVRDALLPGEFYDQVAAKRRELAGDHEPNPDWVYSQGSSPQGIRIDKGLWMTKAEFSWELASQLAIQCANEGLHGGNVHTWGNFEQLYAMLVCGFGMLKEAKEHIKPEATRKWNEAMEHAQKHGVLIVVAELLLSDKIRPKLRDHLRPVAEMFPPWPDQMETYEQQNQYVEAVATLPGRWLDSPSQPGYSVFFTALDHLTLEAIRFIARADAPVHCAHINLASAFAEIPVTPRELFPRLMDVLSNCSRYRDPPDPVMKQVHDGLLNANVVAVPRALFLGLSDRAQEYVAPLTEEQRLQASQQNQWPERMPFASSFLALVPPVAAPPQPNAPARVKQAWVLGYYVTRNTVIMVGLMVAAEEEGYLPFVVREMRQGVWLLPNQAAAWVLPSIMDWINEHRTVIEERPMPSQMAQLRKTALPKELRRNPPPPYYTVVMRDDLLLRSVNRTFHQRHPRTIDWQHRWSVRGHWNYRIRRGKLPLDDLERLQLTKRGYKVCEADLIDFELWQELKVRAIMRQPDEWIAVKKYWTRDHVKGPEDKPFVPSVHVSDKPL